MVVTSKTWMVAIGFAKMGCTVAFSAIVLSNIVCPEVGGLILQSEVIRCHYCFLKDDKLMNKCSNCGLA